MREKRELPTVKMRQMIDAFDNDLNPWQLVRGGVTNFDRFLAQISILADFWRNQVWIWRGGVCSKG